MPEVWRMMKAIFSGVHSEAATIKSPSPSRSLSSVTTTSSPLAKACSTSWIVSAIPFTSLVRCRGPLPGLPDLRQHHYAGQIGNHVLPTQGQPRSTPLVWRFRSPHHSSREFAMRTSEPKPHEINKLLVSFDSEVRKLRMPQNGANFG